MAANRTHEPPLVIGLCDGARDEEKVLQSIPRSFAVRVLHAFCVSSANLMIMTKKT